ncbi:MAG: hypothetical protein AAF960_12450 [Bacteroidota bacterium]
MINLRTENSDSSMLHQYQYMKSQFMEELKTILGDFQISVEAV